LTQLATQKGAVLPDSPDKSDDKMIAHFNSLSGSDFDKAYIKAMVRDHKKDVKEFQKEADSADDPDLKGWVAKTLPTLQDHLSQAQSVEGTVASNK